MDDPFFLPNSLGFTQLRSASLDFMQEKTRILIIRFSSIGDIVLTTPIIRCLKEQLDGGVEIDFITKEAYSSLLTNNPHIHQVLTIREKVSEVRPLLQPGIYDYVIDLHNNLRSKLVKRYTRSLHFTLNKRNVAKWIYVQTKQELMPIGHVVARSFEAIKALGVENDGAGLDFFFPSAFNSSPLPEPFAKGYIAYAIGGQFQGKILPTKKAVALCEALPLPIVLLGGAEDRIRGYAIKDALGEKVFNACGAFSLMESAFVVNEAQALITHDTGMMHIGTALGTPIVSLWFATTPQIGFAPWEPKAPSFIVESKLKARPTSKLGNRGYDNPALFDIDIADVVQKLNQCLTLK